MSPVGVLPVEAMVAVKVTAEPGAASAGAARINIVASPMTCRGILSLLGRNVASPTYCAVMVWIPATVKVESKAAEPLTNGAAPNRLEPSRNVTVPVGAPGLPGPAATLAVIVTLVSAVGSGADTLITLTKPVVIAPNSPSLSLLNCEVK